ncbi:hypothetical protein BGHDH14_bghG001544000001001 [Blumeria hordei DH14]|uniref:Uncharacterized protein n=1 Tax=Blumeria graminis f. sp. hordei (strain DH14) TaxID=546991 RepID=N1J6E7_BLUG1|nr:hypothetical protein BGHDH14_bghG001544000001001 [Blumeria hordei DH14]
MFFSTPSEIPSHKPSRLLKVYPRPPATDSDMGEARRGKPSLVTPSRSSRSPLPRLPMILLRPSQNTVSSSSSSEEDVPHRSQSRASTRVCVERKKKAAPFHSKLNAEARPPASPTKDKLKVENKGFGNSDQPEGSEKLYSSKARTFTRFPRRPKPPLSPPPPHLSPSAATKLHSHPSKPLAAIPPFLSVVSPSPAPSTVTVVASSPSSESAAQENSRPAPAERREPRLRSGTSSPAPQRGENGAVRLPFCSQAPLTTTANTSAGDEIVCAGPPLDIVQLECYHNHRSMRNSPNKRYPVACMVCQKMDTEPRWRCTWCCLSACRVCLGELHATPHRNLRTCLAQQASRKAL